MTTHHHPLHWPGLPSKTWKWPHTLSHSPSGSWKMQRIKIQDVKKKTFEAKPESRPHNYDSYIHKEEGRFSSRQRALNIEKGDTLNRLQKSWLAECLTSPKRYLTTSLNTEWQVNWDRVESSLDTTESKMVAVANGKLVLQRRLYRRLPKEAQQLWTAFLSLSSPINAHATPKPPFFLFLPSSMASFVQIINDEYDEARELWHFLSLFI